MAIFVPRNDNDEVDLDLIQLVCDEMRENGLFSLRSFIFFHLKIKIKFLDQKNQNIQFSMMFDGWTS